MLRQRVQERVGGRVVALPGVAQHAGDRGEQHERAQRLPRGQLVQQPTRVQLRPQHGIQPLRRQPGHGGVLEQAGRMHHADQRPDQRAQQRGQFGAVGDVAGFDPGGCAEVGQVPDQLRRSGRGGASAGGEQQVPSPVPLDQVGRDERAEPAGAAGDQDGPAAQIDRRPLGHGCAGDPGHDQPAVAHRALRLARVQRGGQQPERAGVEVGHPEPVGVLGDSRPDQPPDRRSGQRPAIGQEHQPRAGVPVAGQPLLDQVERAAQAVPDGVARVGVHLAGRDHDHRWRGLRQRGQWAVEDRPPLRGQFGSGHRGQVGSGYRGLVGSGYCGLLGSGRRGRVGCRYRGRVGSRYCGQVGSGYCGLAGSGYCGRVGSGHCGLVGCGGQSGFGCGGQGRLDPLQPVGLGAAPGEAGGRRRAHGQRLDRPDREPGGVVQRHSHAGPRRPGQPDSHPVRAAGVDPHPGERERQQRLGSFGRVQDEHVQRGVQ